MSRSVAHHELLEGAREVEMAMEKALHRLSAAISRSSWKTLMPILVCLSAAVERRLFDRYSSVERRRGKGTPKRREAQPQRGHVQDHYVRLTPLVSTALVTAPVSCGFTVSKESLRQASTPSQQASG